MNMGDWTLICRVEEIPVLGSRRVARPQGMDVAKRIARAARESRRICW